jgi:peroxiredoxin
MLTTATKYPFFDLSEIIPETELSYKAFQPLKPAKAGDSIRGFILHQDHERWQRFYNGGETKDPFLLKELLNKPLVISFYSKHWRNIGFKQLDQLNAIQQEIKANGGNLLIINAEKDEELAKTAWDHSLSLNFYFDVNNEIAKKFSVYSENDPAWNKFSGIDINVPLLATYVINTSREIVYDHVDLNFFSTLSPTNIISAVYKSALFQ